MPAKQKPTPPAVSGDFDSLVSAIVHIHQQSQAFATKAVNVSLTVRNWLIGHRIVAFEQSGKDRAAYGERLLPALAERLSAAGLKRVDARELRRFRRFYGVYPQIWETVTPELLAGLGADALQPLPSTPPPPKRETPSPESEAVAAETPPLSHTYPDLIHHLSFSHLAELLDLPDDTQRRFYEFECIRGNWSVRELRRQITSLYYQRSGLSKDKAKLSAMTHAAADTFHPAHIIRDPYIVAWYKQHQMTPGDQPPIGILLCTRKNDSLVEFALGDLSNQVFVSRYAVELPKKEDMERFIAQLGKEVGA